MFRIDLTKAREVSFSPLPPGKYVVEVTGVESVQSRNGLPGIRFELSVLFPVELAATDAADPSELAGRRLFDSFYQDAKDVGPSRFRQAMLALGFPPEELEGVFEFSEEDVIGRMALVTVRTRTVNERAFDKVTLWEPYVEEDFS